jgi:hypothetical protein
MAAFLMSSIVTIQFSEWLYLIINNRYPQRVVWALYLIQMLLLAVVALEDVESLTVSRSLACTSCSVCCSSYWQSESWIIRCRC